MLWRFYEAFTDPYSYGKQARGIIKRTAIAFSTLADALIAFTAIQVLVGSGSMELNGAPHQQGQIVGDILQHPWGGVYYGFGHCYFPYCTCPILLWTH